MPEPLIHIGYHKTGSTWLQQAIFRDDRIGFATHETPLPVDEAFIAQNPFTFDASRARATFGSALSDAAERGLVYAISHERLSGDVGTGGVDSRMIADRLAESFPGARVLIVLREQRSMLLSIHKTQVRFATQTLEERWRDRTVIERRRAGPTLEYFDYDLLVAYYQKLFGADRVLVLPYEALRADALGFVSQIAKFVELPSPTEVPTEAANPSLPAGILELNRYFNKLLRLVGMAERFEGPLEERRTKRGQLRALEKLAAFVPSPYSRRVERKWRRSVERIAAGRFGESNARTAQLTGLNLAPFGYDVAS